MTTPPPVKITDKDVQKFKALYKKQFGVDLSDADAREQATKLVRLVQLTQRPLSQNERQT